MEIKYIKKLSSSHRWEVWLAEKDGEKVVVKIPAITVTREEIEYYEKRAKIWMEKLNKNPNIARLLGFDRRRVSFIIKFYPKTLRHILNKQGKLSPSLAKGIILSIANALKLAHELGVVHGDIKPENVLIDEIGTPKLTDWEDAILLLEEDNIIKFTPGYAAPEQMEMNSSLVDERIDIYQLGVLLYEMIEGSKPQQEIVFEETPEHIRKVIIKCTKKDRKQRYRTIEELITDLKAESKISIKPTEIEIDLRLDISLPPIERMRIFLREVKSRVLAMSIEKIAKLLKLTTHQVYSAINVLSKETGIIILDDKLVTPRGVINLALRLNKPLAEILSGKSLPLEWWQKLLNEIEKLKTIVPFGNPTETDAAGGSEKILAKVSIYYDYAVPEYVENQVIKYITGRKITDHLIRDMASAFGFPVRIIRGIIEKHEKVLFKYRHRGSIHSVYWSPDGGYIATRDNGGYIRIFRTRDWTKIFEFKHNGLVGAIEWSPEGNFLASGSEDGYIRIFSIKNRNIISRRYAGTIRSMSWSPDGNLLAIGSGDGFVRVLNFDDWSEVFEYLHKDWVSSIHWSIDGKFLATGSGDKYLRVFRRENWEEVFKLRHNGAIKSVCWSPDGIFLATGGSDRYLRVFRVDEWSEVFKYFHGDWVSSICWSPDARYIASGGYDWFIRVFDSREWSVVFKSKQKATVRAVDWSPNGEYIAMGVGDSLIVSYAYFRYWRDFI